jgi:hypothetical protein
VLIRENSWTKNHKSKIKNRKSKIVKQWQREGAKVADDAQVTEEEGVHWD